jgi:hypothetical protein
MTKRKEPKAAGEYYRLVRGGHVQRLRGRRPDTGEPAIAWPVAETHADATRLIEWVARHYGLSDAERGELEVSRIGSVEGETIQGHIASAVKEGCIGACCVRDWQPDGSPVWKWMMFD